MKKKISATVLTLSVLLMAWMVLAASQLFGNGELSILPVSPCRYAHPFHLIVGAHIGLRTDDASVDITLTEGVQLLNGNLHWILKGDARGNGDVVPDTVYRNDLQIELDHPGIYKATATYNPSNVDKESNKWFPKPTSIFFYVREDTIAVFWYKQDMEQAIRDSLVFPGVATRRFWAHQDTSQRAQALRTKRARKKEDDSVAAAIRREMTISDSIEQAHLSDKYTPEQIVLIKQYHLMYARPQQEITEQLITLDSHGNLSEKELHAKILMAQRHLSERYELEQRIIHAVQPEEQKRLLAKRDSLFHPYNLTKAVNKQEK